MNTHSIRTGGQGSLRRTLVIATLTALRFCPAAAGDIASTPTDTANLGPVITVEKPLTISGGTSGPVPISLQWAASPDADIDVDSLRVRYMWSFGSKDITKTVLAALERSASSRLDSRGLYIPNAHLPPGRHRLVIELADTRQRKSQTELEFQVAKR